MLLPVQAITHREHWDRKHSAYIRVHSILALCALFHALGCGGSRIGLTDAPASAVVTVSISPSMATIIVSGTQQFTAIVTGSTDAAIRWQVNGIPGGNSIVGVITSTGLYTAPAIASGRLGIQITAISQADSTKFATATVTVQPAPLPGASYYVATSGDDSNSGTITAPWRTMQHALYSVGAGDTVYVRGGVYPEVITIPISGSATAGYITLQSYPGETAVIDGSTLAVPSTTSGLVNVQDKSYVKIIGFEIRNFKTSNSSALGYVPAGIYVQGAGDHVEIRNNRVHDIQALYRPPAIPALGVADAFGIAVYGNNATAPISNLIVDGNELYNLITGSSESVVLNGNVENWSVTNNLVHDNDNIGIDIIGFEGTSSDPATDQARDGVISGNSVYSITSVGNVAYGSDASADGIYVDGGTRVTVERNLVHNVDIGIEIASEHLGRFTNSVIVRNNLVFFNNVAGISIGGYASNTGGTQNCWIVNNTLFHNDTSGSGSGEFQVQYANSGSTNAFENNIVYAGSQGLLVNSIYANSSAQLASVDYNLYFVVPGAAPTWIWNAIAYAALAPYETAAATKAVKFADPLLLSLGSMGMPLLAPDLHVGAASPAVNAGTNLGSSIVGAVDFAGNPRLRGTKIDMGAYQQ